MEAIPSRAASSRASSGQVSRAPSEDEGDEGGGDWSAFYVPPEPIDEPPREDDSREAEARTTSALVQDQGSGSEAIAASRRVAEDDGWPAERGAGDAGVLGPAAVSPSKWRKWARIGGGVGRMHRMWRLYGERVKKEGLVRLAIVAQGLSLDELRNRLSRPVLLRVRKKGAPLLASQKIAVEKVQRVLHQCMRRALMPFMRLILSPAVALTQHHAVQEVDHYRAAMRAIREVNAQLGVRRIVGVVRQKLLKKKMRAFRIWWTVTQWQLDVAEDVQLQRDMAAWTLDQIGFPCPPSPTLPPSRPHPRPPSLPRASRPILFDIPPAPPTFRVSPALDMANQSPHDLVPTSQHSRRRLREEREGRDASPHALLPAGADGSPAVVVRGYGRGGDPGAWPHGLWWSCGVGDMERRPTVVDCSLPPIFGPPAM
ncbi:unnamed protein product [Vitrella brassicaformis CCMP3155]|uniref:Uncharacterized protein n=2 Tax=Vitrella brassicaformis TaxID=1169539 RepID=A0A0G4EHM2_VITBC|nr:unnamed protein product [Vitrella brassicaformis CCMP3155]|eukprot:CEL95399.1 unnamed protein product [Vitrella brassicaformis CCMP3155]